MDLFKNTVNIYDSEVSAIVKGKPESLPVYGALSGNVTDFNNLYVFPAFCDVHVHFREPGFFYKESIKTGSLAAAAGGYTDVCTMPNLDPVPDNLKALNVQREIIKRDAVIRVHPYGSITVGECGNKLADLDAISGECIGFSDDGKGVQSEQLMVDAMKKAKKLGKIISAHCEDVSLLNGGYINDGEYAKAHEHKGICAESEWIPIERDLRLAAETGCKYHVCHVSTAESVELIRRAKAAGVDVTCETAPHYLVLCDSDLSDDGKFKMNPPLRSKNDRLALIEGIKDGTIDMIATDHAPHSREEKSGGLKNSLMGVVGLETSFSVLYTYLVKTKIISLEKLIELLSVNPRKRFSIPLNNNDYCVFDLSNEYIIDPEKFVSKGKSTPFEGRKVCGKNVLTVCGGKVVWKA